ncbi:hypothetical protein CPB86DRAFT_624583 [Serendipita vermifera]|nr:hypothetical protein CPB86DRAFT_624583 [Serendipita vermifera]
MPIGARAALLKKPIIWEDQITLDKDENEKRGSICWHQLQPTALQMTTPHTTAQFPTQGQNQAGPSPDPSLSRSLPRLFFHHNSAHTAHGPASTPEARNPHDMPTSSSTPPSTQPNMPKDNSTQEIPIAETLEDISGQNSHAPHPVHVTVLISMPDATRPAHSDKTSQLRKSEFKEQNRIPLPSLVLGTTQPNVSLPSLRLKQEELDAWWDLPSYSPHNLYNAPRGIALGPGLGVAFNRFGVQMNPQLAYAMAHERRSRDLERERAHRHYPILIQDLRMSSAGGGR